MKWKKFLELAKARPVVIMLLTIEKV